jgi:hypothetical protein
VRVNGLGLTLRASVSVKNKNKLYIYIVLRGLGKQCKRGDFIINGPLQKKKKQSKYTPTTNSYDFARRSGH